MGKLLSYVDAARLLGGGDAALLKRIDAVAGGVILAVAPGALELVRLGHDLIGRLRERRAGLSRYDRTQRLAAAHTVLAVVAYFEAVAEADLPLSFDELELTKTEQLSIAGYSETDLFVGGLPPLHGAPELLSSYAMLTNRLGGFLSGLSVWDRLTHGQRARLSDTLDQVPAAAVRRYAEHLRRLAADFPEVTLWLGQLEHEATRDAVRGLEPSLIRLERQLALMSSGAVLPAQAGSLARAHRAALARPIVPVGDAPANLTVPTLQQAYVPPRYRVTDADPQSGPSDEQWWEQIDVRDDLEDFLIRYLTSVHSTEAPIMVLGQPGAGKSVLTRVLAARLPAADFLVVHVPLRDVAAEFEIQRQLEDAIAQATGERLAYPALVRSNPGALPVILIDGFDELLQATGVRQTDYLIRVADFQRRELDQGRPVAVVVTTRTSVADRAKTPPGTLLMRLEPFDPPRIRAWVDVWNECNATNFERADTRPLDFGTVMAHADIAGQPLLLLMLALYDADGNALQRLSADVHGTELYEQLLVSFARREVLKHRPDTPDRELPAAIEREMRRLSIVAFAMFNRASQWVTEADLEQDLTAIFGATPPAAEGLRGHLRSSELALGRFFFVHRSRAQRDTTTLHTFEFLHATFGEYLVARLAWNVILDAMARDRATTMPAGEVDELVHALLSFAGLAGRKPIVNFLGAMAAALDDAVQRDVGELLIRLFRQAGFPRPGRAFESYQPRRLNVSARHAAYSANLLLLTVIAHPGGITASEIFGPDAGNVIEAWRRNAMLWQSQLDYDFHGMIDSVELKRFWDGDQRELLLWFGVGEPFLPSPDPLWTYNIVQSEWGTVSWNFSNRSVLQRRVNFMCRSHLDIMLHALEPVLAAVGPHALSRFHFTSQELPDIVNSVGRAITEVWLLATEDHPKLDREEAYLRLARLCVSSTEDGEPYRLVRLLLNALSVDRRATAATAAAVIETLTRAYKFPFGPIASAVIDCVLAFMLRDEVVGADQKRLAAVVAPMLDHADMTVRLRYEARIAELDPGHRG